MCMYLVINRMDKRGFLIWWNFDVVNTWLYTVKQVSNNMGPN